MASQALDTCSWAGKTNFRITVKLRTIEAPASRLRRTHWTWTAKGQGQPWQTNWSTSRFSFWNVCRTWLVKIKGLEAKFVSKRHWERWSSRLSKLTAKTRGSWGPILTRAERYTCPASSKKQGNFKPTRRAWRVIIETQFQNSRSKTLNGSKLHAQHQIWGDISWAWPTSAINLTNPAPSKVDWIWVNPSLKRSEQITPREYGSERGTDPILAAFKEQEITSPRRQFNNDQCGRYPTARPTSISESRAFQVTFAPAVNMRHHQPAQHRPPPKWLLGAFGIAAPKPIAQWE